MAICGGERAPWFHRDQSPYWRLSQAFLRSGDASGFVLRVEDGHEELFSVALPEDFVHPHARPKLESHIAPIAAYGEVVWS
jgi:hypothetical protein